MNQFDVLRPGDIVIMRGKPRVVICIGRYCIAFRKIRGSWTNPNPTAWYDKRMDATGPIEFTGKQAKLTRMERQYATPDSQTPAP